jgi:hypothetical protein
VLIYRQYATSEYVLTNEQQEAHAISSGHQYGLAAIPVRETASDEIGDRLGEAEDANERQRRADSAQPKRLLGQQRQHRPLLTDQSADEGVHADEQAELAEVDAQSELWWSPPRRVTRR